MALRRNRMLYIVIVVIAVVAVFLVWRQFQPSSDVLAASPGLAQPQTSGVAVAATSGLIRPLQYQSQFVESGEPHLLVDVRTPQEFNSGYIEGAVNIPLQSLAQRMNEIPQDQPVVLYCRSGNRSATAAQLLARAGYDQVYDLGGVIDWQSQGLPLQ
jgi:phage shock protein E